MQKIALIFLSVVFGIACEHFTKSNEVNAQRVKPGQTSEQIHELLGNPSHAETSGEREIWYYDIAADSGRRSYPYKATFDHGILKSWDFDTTSYSGRVNLNEQRARAQQTPPSVPFAQPAAAPPLQP